MKGRIIDRIMITVALLGGLLCPPAQSAYLEEDPTATPAVREFVPPERIPVPPPPPRDPTPFRRLIERVEIGRPHQAGWLTIFPLLLRDTGDQPDIRTLDEALNRGWITVREQDEARVSEVLVRNESRYPVFMMAGEILGGGRQDRIIRNDVLVGPGRETVTVPVYCGEQDRWKGARDSFDHSPYLAGQSMRGMAARAASQEAIWSEIDGRLKQSGVSAPTRSYQSLYNDRDLRRRIDTLVDRFHGIRTRRTVGLVILHSGRVVSGDLFGSPDLCERLWDKIIRSHAADGILRDPGYRDAELRVEDSSMAVRRFLEDLSRAGQTWEDTPGAGESFALTGRVDGHILSWGGGLVHAAAFPAGGPRPLPTL
ncbi:MAG: DUF6569 family protein [bacterium]